MEEFLVRILDDVGVWTVPVETVRVSDRVLSLKAGQSVRALGQSGKLGLVDLLLLSHLLQNCDRRLWQEPSCLLDREFGGAAVARHAGKFLDSADAHELL